ncbi:MAG: TrmH family RNA methyltransferase [Candidatus ainarchaeum sp.]|nr:TrmH family RNA methyltransferase [Candidatus ainarchaeum sp.]
MTQYLINLARFVSYREKKEIFKELKDKGIKTSNDSWSYRRFILDRLPPNKPYVASTIELKETFSPKTIADTVDRLDKYKIKEIKAKINAGVPFHAKAIVDRYLKKKKFEDNGKIIYLEARMESDNPVVRIGEYINLSNILENRNNSKAKERSAHPTQSAQNKNNLNRNPKLKDTSNILNKNNLKDFPDLAIESPYTLGEISDFVRLSKTFKMKVFIITNKDNECEETIRKFLETNSFNKGNIKVIKAFEEIENDYTFLGFSMWGKVSVQEIMQTSMGKPKLLIFGNEKRGLLKKTMDKCSKIIKIETSSSEPLRATQAATFALGYIFSNK